MGEFKPVTIQFRIEDEKLASELNRLADRLGNKQGNRVLGRAAAAKKILLEVLKSGRANDFLDLGEQSEDAARPKPQTARQRSHQAGS